MLLYLLIEKIHKKIQCLLVRWYDGPLGGCKLQRYSMNCPNYEKCQIIRKKTDVKTVREQIVLRGRSGQQLVKIHSKFTTSFTMKEKRFIIFGNLAKSFNRMYEASNSLWARVGTTNRALLY